MRESKYRLDEVKDDYKDSKDGLIIAKDYENGDRKTKQFCVLDKAELQKIKSDNHLYELIFEKQGYCYKMYYDIDLYINKADITDYNNKLKDFIKVIANIYKELDENFNKAEIIELDASRDSIDGKYKLSKHFILPIYVEKPENLYVLFTYVNTKIQEKINGEIYDAIDKEVYIKTSKKSHQLRLLGQTKIGKPESILKCENPNIKLMDTLITQYDTDGKKLIDITNIEIKLKKMGEKRGYMMNGVESIIDKDDLKIGNMGYNYKDMLNINLKIPKISTSINNMEVINYYRQNGLNIVSDCRFYLSVIENTPIYKQSFRLWWVIGTILKKYNINYDIFEEWTLKAYTKDLDKVANECRRKWDMMKTTKYGLIHLINIAKLYNKEIYLKKVFAKKFIHQYYYDKDEWEMVKMGANETMDINKYYKQGYSGLITDENVGGGKTNAVIRFTKENIDKDIFIIIFSNRILFATDISSRFEAEIGEDKVVNYDDNRKELPDLKDKKVLVISFESLLKWKDVIKKRCGKLTKLICIYDEFETLHRNLIGGTIKKPYKTIAYVSELWKISKFNIIIDAYMTINTYDYVNKQNQLSGKTNKMIYIDTENRNKYPKTFNIRGIAKSKDERENMMKRYTKDMGEVLTESEDNKIVIFCEVYTSVQYIYSYLINTLKIPAEKILKHTGKDKDFMTDEDIEEAKSYFKKKEKMKDIRVWIYTSSILNGISIENVKFNKCYGIITKYSKQLQSSVGILGNDFLNAVARARLNNEWELYVDEKENIAFTYKKYKEMNTDVSIDSKIDVAINNEINAELLKKRVEEDETDDENDRLDISVEIAELNSYIRCPSKYRFELTSGMRGDTYLKIYEKYDMTSNILYTILYDTYLEWKEKEYLAGDAVANDIINIVLKNNMKTEELNGVFKIEVVECLAKLKNNNINWCCESMKDIKPIIALNDADDNKNVIPVGKMKSVVVNNWENRSLYHIDRIHTIAEKYYGKDGDDKEDFVKVIMGNHTIRRYIENWMAIITKKRNDSFNPLFVIDILKRAFNIKKLNELPDEITPEKIEELELYDNCKDIINNFKRSIGCKITPDAKTRKAPIFMKYLNEILKDTGYSYVEKKKRGYIVKYELSRVKVEIEVNGGGGYLYDNRYFEVIWENKRIQFLEEDEEDEGDE